MIATAALWILGMLYAAPCTNLNQCSNTNLINNQGYESYLMSNRLPNTSCNLEECTMTNMSDCVGKCQQAGYKADQLMNLIKGIASKTPPITTITVVEPVSETMSKSPPIVTVTHSEIKTVTVSPTETKKRKQKIIDSDSESSDFIPITPSKFRPSKHVKPSKTFKKPKIIGSSPKPEPIYTKTIEKTADSNSKDDVTVTKVLERTSTIEKPITLYRELTKTLTKEKPVTSFKVTTLTETSVKVETTTVISTTSTDNHFETKRSTKDEEKVPGMVRTVTINDCNQKGYIEKENTTTIYKCDIGTSTSAYSAPVTVTKFIPINTSTQTTEILTQSLTKQRRYPEYLSPEREYYPSPQNDNLDPSFSMRYYTPKKTISEVIRTVTQKIPEYIPIYRTLTLRPPISFSNNVYESIPVNIESLTTVDKRSTENMFTTITVSKPFIYKTVTVSFSNTSTVSKSLPSFSRELTKTVTVVDENSDEEDIKTVTVTRSKSHIKNTTFSNIKAKVATITVDPKEKCSNDEDQERCNQIEQNATVPETIPAKTKSSIRFRLTKRPVNKENKNKLAKGCKVDKSSHKPRTICRLRPVKRSTNQNNKTNMESESSEEEIPPVTTTIYQ